MLRLSTVISAAALAATLAVAAQPELPVAKPTQDGKTLVVPEAHQAKGTVYYAITDRDRQVYFESNAPLENIKGQSNGVIGYASVAIDAASTVDPAEVARDRDRLRREGRSDAEALRLAAVDAVVGEFHLPVRSMRTGIELRDEHMAGSDWLDAEANPDIIVRVIGVTSLKPARATERFRSFEATLVTDLTLHGVTRTIEIPGSTVTLLPESDSTRRVARGDLMAIRSTFTVVLADYGVSHPVIGEKVARDVEIDVSLFLSTLSPQRQ